MIISRKEKGFSIGKDEYTYWQNYIRNKLRRFMNIPLQDIWKLEKQQN